MRAIILSLTILLMSSCTIYTEKRSEALSQAVYATADSVDAARFDLADKYSKESEKLAFPPKKRIKISPILTKRSIPVVVKSVTPINSPIVEKKMEPQENSTIEDTTVEDKTMRLVVPEKFESIPVLVENSPEWKELQKTKEFAKNLAQDNKNLETLKIGVEKELQKQNEMNNKMVKDLNVMQKKLVEKDLVILRLWVSLISVIIVFLGAVYLRIKGVL